MLLLRKTLLPLAAAATLLAAGPAHAFAPANDDMADATNVTTAQVVGTPSRFESADVGYTTKDAGLQTGETKHEDGMGRTVWFKWTAGADGGAFVNNCGAQVNQTVRVFWHVTGAVTPANMALAAAGQATAPAASFCKYSFIATKGRTYYIQLDTMGASQGWSFVLSQETAKPAAPSIPNSWPLKTAGTFTQSFTKNPSAAQHVCWVTGSSWKACAPGDKRTAPDGPASFAVRAIDSYGNESASAEKKWTVDAKAPQLSVLTGPPNVTFSVNETATVACRLDGDLWKSCTSGKTGAEEVGAGTHELELRATDAVGSVAPIVPITWTVAAPGATTPEPAPAVPPVRATPPAATQTVPSTVAAKPSCVQAAKLPAKVRLATARKGLKVAGCAVAYRQKGKRLTRAAAVRRGTLEVVVSKGAQKRTLKLRVV